MGHQISENPRGASIPQLASVDVGVRLDAVLRIAEAGVQSRHVEALTRTLLTDPDPSVRAAAARTLAAAATPLAPAIISRALADPDDGVRAAAVGAAAPTANPTPILIPLVGDRGHPRAQRAALAALRFALAARAPGRPELRALVETVGGLDPPPSGEERALLRDIVAAIGVERLVREAWVEHAARLGTARLLLVSGEPGGLRAVARLADDPAEDLRLLAGLAADLLQGMRDAERATVEPAPATGAGLRLDHAMFASLARGLGDVDAHVREEAHTALLRLPREATASWVGWALSDAPAETAALAATLLQRIAVEAAPADLLRRAASGMGPEGPAEFLAALRSLRLPPVDLAGLAVSADETYRQQAVRLVWRAGGRAVLPHLAPLLEDSAGPVRMAVLEVLSEAEDPSWVEVAERVLATDSSAAVRATAVQLAARAGGRARLPALQVAIRDPDPDVRATAVETLGDDGHPETSHLLAQAFGDQDERVWRGAIPGLVKASERTLGIVWDAMRGGGHQKQQELLEALERRSRDRLEALASTGIAAADAADRALAVEVAARAATQGGTNLVLRAMADPDPVVRRTAASALTTLRTPAATQALTSALADPHTEVRVAAARALGFIDDDHVPQILVTAMKDPEVRVRAMAGEALSRWTSPTVARRLTAALRSADIRRAAAEALERMGAVAVDPLLDILPEADPEIRAIAGQVLRRLVGTDTFLGALSSTDADRRLRSVEVLGAIGGGAALEGLQGALSDPEVGIRARAATLLGDLGDPRAVTALRQVFTSDPVPEVAAAAEASLARLSRGTEPIPPDSGDHPNDGG